VTTAAGEVALRSNLGTVRVHVVLPPDDEGEDPPPDGEEIPAPNQAPDVLLRYVYQWVHEGEAVSVTAFPEDPDGPTDIQTVEWDFDYDGATFTPDATGATPIRVFDVPGFHLVAVRVTDTAGQTALDAGFIEVLTADDRPNLWADWTGDGTFDLVLPAEWEQVSTDSGGTASFLLKHTYEDSRTYQAAFRVEDAEGLAVASSVPVAVANVVPTLAALNGPPFRIKPGDAAQTVTWAANGASGALTIAGKTLQGIGQQAAEGFMKQVEAFGGSVVELWTPGSPRRSSRSS
jgi:hypothetical protein